MKALAIMTAAALIVALAMAGLVNASPTPDVRPKPKPPMECSVVNGEIVKCEVRG